MAGASSANSKKKYEIQVEVTDKGKKSNVCAQQQHTICLPVLTSCFQQLQFVIHAPCTSAKDAQG